jgi:hypothetical protein
VPERSGELVIGGATMSWWDVGAGIGKTERLGDLRLSVSPGQVGGGVGGVPAAASPTSLRAGESVAVAGQSQLPRSPWVWLTVGFAVLWLLTLLWALRRRPAQTAPHPREHAGTPLTAGPAGTPAQLRQALDTGSLDDVAEAVRQLHAPPLRDLDAVIAQLARADQRAALEALRRARWADGDGAAARQALRAAFADGPHWRAGPAVEPAPLPPLYPQS